MTNEELKMCARCQIRWERDRAMEQLEEHHIPFMCIAEDVVEVVRCRDCEYWKPIDEHFGNCHNGCHDENWFCCDGDRREE